MEVKIKVKKILSRQGQRMAQFVVGVENDVLTPCIFAREDTFRLRKVENGQLGSDDDVILYSSVATVPVEDDQDIEEKIEEIVNLYKEVWGKNRNWDGEKEYRYKV